MGSIQQEDIIVVNIYALNIGASKYIKQYWDFPGGPVVKTLCSQCRGHGFDPWSGN